MSSASICRKSKSIKDVGACRRWSSTNLELLQGDYRCNGPGGARDSSTSSSATACTAGCRRTCRRRSSSAFDTLLSPEGVAYISYNVYPGWKAKEIVRDAMLLRGGERATPEEKLIYARGMIDFLEQVAPSRQRVGPKALPISGPTTRNTRDYYVLHEYLETFNSTVLLP